MASLLTPWLLPIGLLTVIVATLGVLASRELRRLLAHLVVLSAGTLILTLGLDSEAATSAALYYALNSTLVAGGLFLLADLIARERGEAQARLTGTGRRAAGAAWNPVLRRRGGCCRLPPLAGFAAKLYILQSAFLHPAASWVFSVVLLSGLLVIVALSRAGSALFWRTGEAAAPRTSRSLPSPPPPCCCPAPLFSCWGGYGNVFYPGHRGTACRPSAYIDAVMSNQIISSPDGGPDVENAPCAQTLKLPHPC